MKISIYQRFRFYKQDSLKYLLFEIFNWQFLIFLLLWLIIGILYYLNRANYINFYQEIIELLIFSLSIGALGMILYSCFFLLRKLWKINNEANTVFEGILHINFKNDCIIIKNDTEDYFIKRDWLQMKEFIVIRNTGYLVPLKKDDSIIRINKKEIIEGKFEDVISFINSKWKIK